MIEQAFSKLHMKKFFLPILFFLPSLIFAQVPNDECMFATHLGAIDIDVDFCTTDGEFDNIGATQSPQVLPFCWFNDGIDVWFSFVPTGPGVYIQLFGDADNTMNNFDSPSMALYSGTCNNLTELGCASINSGANIIELISTQLIIGEVHYLRVAARNNNQGEFEMCLRSYIPTPSPESDCPQAVVLCNKDGFVVENLDEIGVIQDELTGSCVPAGATGERASVWYTWTCDISGTLEFTIDPNNPNTDQEDIDFVVYRFPDGLDNCNTREALRCMLSGETAGQESSPCYGATGLMAGDPDISEAPGCQPGDNNFVAPIDMISGESYGVLINNYSQSGFGFSIEFGGSGTFQGPVVDFAIDSSNNVECEKEITFSSLAESLVGGGITDYFWTFGVGATPSNTANTVGDHTITYNSFGEKIISLTVTTEEGCTVTEIKKLFVEPCCKDTTTLMAAALGDTIFCADQLGTGMAIGISGAPQYQYAIDSPNDFQPNPNFPDLVPGPYTVYVQDIKGCIEEATLEIIEPDEFLGVDIITPDTTILLANTIDIETIITPSTAGVTITWEPTDGLSCSDCPNPTVTASGTTTYTITVQDEDGCIVREDITIITEIFRPVFGPEIFTPEGTDNQIFTVGVGPQARSINSLRVYDRWGNLVYEGFGLPINDFSVGWDGRFKGELVNPAVFTWIVEVEFIDDVIEFVTGDVTVYR